MPVPPSLLTHNQRMCSGASPRRRRPPSQGWKTFLRNHADGIPSMDLFVNPTISFRLLYGFLILRHSRREVLRLGVTAPSERPIDWHRGMRLGTV